ncbi:putative ubiquitin carboxyl-terminal hydrolase MINDY-4 [Bulinus truncatus]|nr:putative ubiquitin carboxyl-terminal hydrolase MINDY-4 [Bulinus truncatus]
MSAGNSFVEAATASLVREYLSRKGLKGTLEKMDVECPRDDLSINNRQNLMKHEEKEPLKSMLEVMTKSFMDGSFNESDKQNLKNANYGSLTRQSPEVPDGGILNKHVSNSSKTNLLSSDLIIDDDIEGECLTGGGKSGLLNMDLQDSPPMPNCTKISTARPLSAKKLESITSNSSNKSARKRPNMLKPTRLSVSQLEQQKKGIKITENNNGQLNFITKSSISDDKEIYYKESTSNSNSPNFQNHVKSKENPVSFEALILKGEERANLLKQIGLERGESEKLTCDQPYKVETSSIYKEKCKPVSSNNQSGSSSSMKMTDLEIGDVDELEISSKGTAVVHRPEKIAKLTSCPLDLRAAIALKNIVLGSPTQLFNDEWLKQSLTFCEVPDIKYGIIQNKGGPCGVLAAVQACFLQELLFGENKLPHSVFKNPAKLDRSKLLAIALSHIFWRAGNYSTAVVATVSGTTHLLNSTKFKQDGITEKLSLYTFSSFSELSDFMILKISEFEYEGSPGVALTMYSAILSRKVHLARADFDDPDHTTFIGNHGYCTLELVNLLLTGQAVSNVFNDIKQLEGSGIGDTITLKGLSKRSDIGFLSLFEHYQSCEVGTFYKTPKNPIWVIYSESHFSVLFATKQELVSDWRAERIFDLYYYDGLARQQEEIKLTINTLNPSFKAPKGNDEDLVPPLEHCIRTKWSDAEINWNGYEPIL